MPKINGEHICEFCNHKFLWEGRLRQYISERLVGETISEGYKEAIPIYENDKIKFIKCCCPNCGELLRFDPSVSTTQ